MKLNFKNNQAFSLIELMIGALIVSLLSGLLVIVITNSEAKNKIDLNTVKTFDLTIKNKLADNLIGDWSFDEGTGTILYDSSDYKSDATISGAAWTTGANCVSKSCLEFSDASQYASINTVANNNILKYSHSKLSAFAWVYLTGALPAGGGTIISNTDTHGWAFRILNSGLINADLRLSGTSFNAGFGTYTVPLNTWTFVGFSYSGSDVTGFANGNIVGSGVASGTILNTSNVNTCTFIGNEPSGCTVQANFNFPGRINEVTVYSNSFNLSEVRTYYLTGLQKLLAKGEITQKDYNQRIAELQKQVAAK
jgi:hypothetical protein